MVKVLCSDGERMDRCERRELTLRMIGCDSLVADVLSFDRSELKSASERLER